MAVLTPDTIKGRVASIEAAALSFVHGFADEAAYDCRAVLGENPETTALDDDLYDVVVALGTSHAEYGLLQKAEADLCLVRALASGGLRFSETGGVLTAVGTPQGGTKMLSEADETAKRANAIRARAEKTLHQMRARRLDAIDADAYDDDPEVVYGV